MPSLQSLKKSIDSAVKLQTIISTMKAHASTNIVQFEHYADASMKYRAVLDMALHVILSQEEQEIASTQINEKGITIHIVFGSDHGLAGRFNERISLFALENIPRGADHKVIVIGQQVINRLENDLVLEDTFFVPQTEDAITNEVQKILLSINRMMDKNNIIEILLYYCKPLENASFNEQVEVLFPIDLKDYSNRTSRWESHSLPTYSMNKEQLMSDLMKQYFFLTLYRSFCFSLVSENTSRIESMNSASKNIEERLDHLNFLYRQERQTNITNEINDVVSGFKSIKKSKT